MTGRTGFLDSPGGDGVVAGVAQDDKTFLDQFPCGFQRPDGIGQKRLLIAEDFKFDPIGPGIPLLFEQIPAQERNPDRVLGTEAARRVGQNDVFAQVEEI